MKKNMVGIIPARIQSTRFPRKILAEISGKPMIQWVYEAAKRASSLQSLIVATDSEEIENAVKKFNGISILTSPDHQTGLDRIMEVIDKIDNPTHIINIQGDEPLINPETINGVANLFIKYASAHITTAATRINEPVEFFDPNNVKVVLNQNLRALYFSRSAIPFNQDFPEKMPDIALKHLGIYGYTIQALRKIKSFSSGTLENIEKLEQLRFLENGMEIYVHTTEHDSIGVDVPDDIMKVRARLIN